MNAVVKALQDEKKSIELPQKCDVCGQSFSGSVGVAVHKRMVHN